jgi:hypothetical protein
MDEDYRYTDKHSERRDKKLSQRSKQKAMRGDRSVFLAQEMIVKRGKHAKERYYPEGDT